jgi:hypothetical protein
MVRPILQICRFALHSGSSGLISAPRTIFLYDVRVSLLSGHSNVGVTLSRKMALEKEGKDHFDRSCQK